MQEISLLDKSNFYLCQIKLKKENQP